MMKYVRSKIIIIIIIGIGIIIIIIGWDYIICSYKYVDFWRG